MAAASTGEANGKPQPLSGIRVLELGQLIAGPFAGNMLAYFGAEVIKVETPGRGDPLRNWRVLKDGTSLWWRSISRNKKCITLNLREEQGRDIARRLLGGCDVLLENFRPGTLEKWGLGPTELERLNPELVVARISGFGQDGPYAGLPGFASACEGYGGLRYVNGFPGQAPVRANLSLGDTLAALHAVIGVLLALIDRSRRAAGGQQVDVAIYESVFNVLEGVIPEYAGAGVVREPSGTTVTGIVPTNTYLCSDGKYVVIGGNGDSIFRRLMALVGREDMAADPRMADNAGRVQHQQAIDQAIGEWTTTLTCDEAIAQLNAAAVPCGPIYSAADMLDDPHFQARGLFEQADADGQTYVLPALAPRLSATPGASRWAGPELGAHNKAIYCDLLEMSEQELARLQAAGIV